MVSELLEEPENAVPMASSKAVITTLEPELSLQTLHQCNSLISLNLDSSNYLLWRSQMEPLIQSINMTHHLNQDNTPSKEITKENGETAPSPSYLIWVKNDGLLTAWILSNISTEVLISLENVSSASNVWKSIEELILPITVEKEMVLNDALMSLKRVIFH